MKLVLHTGGKMLTEILVSFEQILYIIILVQKKNKFTDGGLIRADTSDMCDKIFPNCRKVKLKLSFKFQSEWSFGVMRTCYIYFRIPSTAQDEHKAMKGEEGPGAAAERPDNIPPLCHVTFQELSLPKACSFELAFLLG